MLAWPLFDQYACCLIPSIILYVRLPFHIASYVVAVVAGVFCSYLVYVLLLPGSFLFGILSEATERVLCQGPAWRSGTTLAARVIRLKTVTVVRCPFCRPKA